MAYWPRAPGGTSNGEEDAEGVEVLHRFFASYHACGPQDNAGKDPRISMERDIGFLKAGNLYNYHECWNWCRRNMPGPSLKHRHDGTWGCNGEFIWCVSLGVDLLLTQNLHCNN